MKQKYVKRKVPLDIIFSQDNLVMKDNIYHDELTIWQDIPIINLSPYLSALKSIIYNQGSLDDYLSFEKKRLYPKKVILEELTKKLKKEITIYKNIITNNKPIIGKIDRDRLILKEGNLECALAKLKGKKWVTVLMSETIAKKWDSRTNIKLEEELKKQNRKKIYTPIMHEKYKKMEISRSGIRRLDMIRNFIGPVHKSLSLLDIGCNTGFYTFHFFRQGFNVKGIDIDREHLDIARALRSMYSADIPFEECSVLDIHPGNRFDIVLGMTVFYHLLGFGSIQPVLTPNELGKILDELVEHALFWESGNRKDEEIAIIKENSGLKYYLKLGNTNATGIVDREFGVFTRQPPKDVQELFKM